MSCFIDGCGDCSAGEESIVSAAEMADLLALLDGSQTVDQGRSFS
jgi:hypothetical protein